MTINDRKVRPILAVRSASVIILRCLRCWRSRSCPSFLCLKITQQAGKRFPVCVVVLLVLKVANVPCPANAGCPCLSGLHDALIQPDGK
jgi:hypothetical protein